MSNNESNEQLLAAGKSIVDVMASTTRVALATAENLVTLNFEAAREAFETGVENAQALLNSRSPQEAAELQSTLGKAGVDQAAAYSRSVYEVSTKAAGELTALLQSQFETLTRIGQEMTQQAAQASPFGTDLAQAAAQQAAQLSENYRAALSSVLQTVGAKKK